jgi:hypothetical protein
VDNNVLKINNLLDISHVICSSGFQNTKQNQWTGVETHKQCEDAVRHSMASV